MFSVHTTPEEFENATESLATLDLCLKTNRVGISHYLLFIYLFICLFICLFTSLFSYLVLVIIIVMSSFSKSGLVWTEGPDRRNRAAF